MLGLRDGLQWTSPAWWHGSTNNIAWTVIALALAALAFGYLHFRLRRFAAGRIVKRIAGDHAPGHERERMQQAFLHNTRPWHSIFRKAPVGWHNRSRRHLQSVIAQANQYVQTLNDKFTDPSGEQVERVQPATAPAATAPVIQSAGYDPSSEEPQEQMRS